MEKCPGAWTYIYQKRENHHENHGVHQDVGDLPLLTLLEVTLTAKSLQSQWVRNLVHLCRKKQI